MRSFGTHNYHWKHFWHRRYIHWKTSFIYFSRVHCPGNKGNLGKVREKEKWENWSGKVREFEKERGKSWKSRGILIGYPYFKFITPQVQLDDLSFCRMLCQEVMENFLRPMRSHGKVKENESRKKSPPSGM